MKENETAEDSRLQAVAASISGGSPVNWSDLRERPDKPEETAVMAELQLLEGLSRINEPMPVTWGPFTISGEIGRGSFGTVYRAVDPNLQLEVALKVIRHFPGAAIDASRALSEARLLAQISHPNVVRVYRAERIGNEVGLAMELVKGHSLGALVKGQGPCSASEAMLIGVDVCKALAAVHAAKVLHGDIKAHNVMRAEGGRTVLMDFGAGKDLKSEAMQGTSSITGTPLYLAPEVLAGAPPTKASDIYSVGVLLYYLASGSYPVQGTTRTQIERAHSHGTPRKPLRDIRPDLPDGFIQVVNRALAEQPRNRHQSAGELEEELNRALGLAHEEAAGSFAWKRWLIAAALVLGVALSVSFAYFSLLPQAAGADKDVGGQAAPTASASAVDPPPVAGASPDSYRIEAALCRQQDGTDVRLQPAARVAPGDLLCLQVRASVPIYVYVVNEDEQGESYLLFPLPGESTTNPLPAVQQHRLPGVQNGKQISWEVSSPGGREHFLIFATPQPPSPAFERMFATLPRPTGSKAVLYHRLSNEAMGVLRGVGGLSSTQARADQPLRFTQEFATPLTGTEEAVRGMWVRQVTLENPAR